MKLQNQARIEQTLRILVSRLLRIGVFTAMAFIVAGAVLFFIQHHGAAFSYHAFAGEPERLRRVWTIISQAFTFRSRAVIQLGVLVLLATPVLRVLSSLIGFAAEKDWIYTGITAVVLAVLMLSIVIV